MAELDPLPDEPVIATDNRRVAAGMLVALIVGALLLVAAGQAFAHEEGCGEPSGQAQPIARVAA